MAGPRYIEDAATFEPDAISILTQALDEVCVDLHIPADQTHSREAIAERLIELARTGVIDVKALHDRVVAEAKLDE